MSAKTVVVTGASSGIGYALAAELLHNGHRVIACGRRDNRLDELQNETAATDQQLLKCVFDVRHSNEVAQCFEHLPQEWHNIDVLFNNAGNAIGFEPIQDGHPADWDLMIDTNIKGMLYVAHAVLPYMIKQNKGHIINMGSIAGKWAYPNGNVYCATKFAIDGLTQSMRYDLLHKGIKVAAIHPGMVNTEFSTTRFKGDRQRADSVYEGVDALTAKDIADVAMYMIEAPDHVNIADVVVLASQQATASFVHRKKKQA